MNKTKSKKQPRQYTTQQLGILLESIDITLGEIKDSIDAIFERLNGRGSVETYDDGDSDEEEEDTTDLKTKKRKDKSYSIARVDSSIEEVDQDDYEYYVGKLHVDGYEQEQRNHFSKRKQEAAKFYNKRDAEEMTDHLAHYHASYEFEVIEN